MAGASGDRPPLLLPKQAWQHGKDAPGAPATEGCAEKHCCCQPGIQNVPLLNSPPPCTGRGACPLHTPGSAAPHVLAANTIHDSAGQAAVQFVRAVGGAIGFAALRIHGSAGASTAVTRCNQHPVIPLSEAGNALEQLHQPAWVSPPSFWVAWAPVLQQAPSS